MNEWSLNIYKNFDDELETVWKELEHKCHHYYIFQCYDWLFHWQQTIGYKDFLNPLIITVSHRDSVVALYPFALRRFMGAKILEFMGGEQSDYNAPIIADDYLSTKNMLTIWHIVKVVLPAHHIKLFLHILNIVKSPFFRIDISFYSSIFCWQSECIKSLRMHYVISF